MGDRVLNICKTKIPNEYREKGIRCFKNLIFQTHQFFQLIVNPTHSF